MCTPLLPPAAAILRSIGHDSPTGEDRAEGAAQTLLDLAHALDCVHRRRWTSLRLLAAPVLTASVNESGIRSALAVDTERARQLAADIDGIFGPPIDVGRSTGQLVSAMVWWTISANEAVISSSTSAPIIEFLGVCAEYNARIARTAR